MLFVSVSSVRFPLTVVSCEPLDSAGTSCSFRTVTIVASWASVYTDAENRGFLLRQKSPI